MTTLPNLRQAVPFFLVKDMTASISFYVDKLRFKITNEWIPHDKIEWCCLERDGVALMLQEPRNPELFEGIDKGLGVSVYFICNDALALYHEFKAAGAAMQQPFVGNSMCVVSLVDPDGYKINFESETDTAEGTIYNAG